MGAEAVRRPIEHTPADGIPWYPSASYVVVARWARCLHVIAQSHAKHAPGGVPPAGRQCPAGWHCAREWSSAPLVDVHEFSWWWLENPVWFEHVASFWQHVGEPNVLFVHYNDMKADLDGQMRRVAAFLGIAVEDSRWPEAVERCTFDSMKKRSNEISDFANLASCHRSGRGDGRNGRRLIPSSGARQNRLNDVPR